MEEKKSSTSNNDTSNQEENAQENTQENPEGQLEVFKDIFNDEDLERLLKKYGLDSSRDRKLSIYNFFWLMVLSAGDPSRRGTLLNIISFFLGSIALLTTITVGSISKSAVSQRLSGTTWYFFRGVYNHLLDKYKNLLSCETQGLLKKFKDILAIDGSLIGLCKQVENLFASTNKGLAALKLNTRFSILLRVVTKLRIGKGRQHDSQFKFVTKTKNVLYLVDLGYWSFKLMQDIIDAGSYFVMRLKSDCDPLIMSINCAGISLEHLIEKRLSEVKEWLMENGLTELDVTVQLSRAENPKFVENIRLVGLLHNGEWYFYVTNIFDAAFTVESIYKLYSLRWQVEIFFNVIKNVLNLQNIVSRNKNGIMVEIYSALIMYILTQIVIALAAKKQGESIHNYSFENCAKLLRGFLITNLRLFFEHGCKALDMLLDNLINTVTNLGRRRSKSPLLEFEEMFVT